MKLLFVGRSGRHIAGASPVEFCYDFPPGVTPPARQAEDADPAGGPRPRAAEASRLSEARRCSIDRQIV